MIENNQFELITYYQVGSNLCLDRYRQGQEIVTSKTIPTGNLEDLAKQIIEEMAISTSRCAVLNMVPGYRLRNGHNIAKELDKSKEKELMKRVYGIN